MVTDNARSMLLLYDKGVVVIDAPPAYSAHLPQAIAEVTTKPITHAANPWAGFDNYIDRVAAQCVNTLTPKWSARLAAFDVFVWDQCYAREQSLRIE
jgi:hypothetical protein